MNDPRLSEATEDQLQEALESRISERICDVAEAARLVYRFARVATTAEFRAVIERTGGLSVSWTARSDGEEVASIAYDDQLYERVMRNRLD